MTLSEELAWRGFVNQTTLDDLRKLDDKKVTFYNGYDASSDSLTIGNLAALMLDKCFIKHGHQAVLLAGGATSLIGDPGGKDSERQLQSAETVAANLEKVKQQIEKLFGGEVTMVNNLDWFKEMNILEFLRDVGKHFSMTPLVQRDYIAKRMGEGGSGISYTEFSYTLLQGYDFLRLFEDRGVTLQLAGSDQWGNGLSGVGLVRRVKGAEVDVLTCPLIVNKATGKKFGKSEAGSIWLDSTKTSVYQFYQYWLNVDDEGVEGYLKVFTELDQPAVERTMDEFNEHKGGRHAQKTLTYEVTKLVHGQEQADKQVHIAEAIAKQDLSGLSDTEIATLRAEIAAAKVAESGLIIDALMNSGLASSKTEAQRLLNDNAISINGQKAQRQNFEPSDFQSGRLLLRRGKAFKDSALVEIG